MKSSAPQLGRFLSMMLGWGEMDGTRVLDSATVARMITIQNPAGVGLVWHHGYVGQREVWSHAGMWNGISTWIGFCRAENAGVVVLCNLEAVHGSILGVIAPALFDLAASAVADSHRPQTARPEPAASVVRNVLFLPEAPSHELQAASLLNIAGRSVLDLHPGANDISGLAPGVYLVRAASRMPSVAGCRKVILTR
jgi:hypothetical protein